MDIDIANRADWERRRKIRLTQVRDQSKHLAKAIRDRVNCAVETKAEQHETARNKTEHKFKSLALSKLKSDFNYLIQDVGSGYSVASIQPDPNVVLAEKRLINRCKAMSRGAEAEKRQRRIQEEQQMDVEMKERQTHFNKTVEKIRSTLISTKPKVDGTNYNIQNINKKNECFLIPSQVTLNEANIINWNHNKKTSKPWSMVLNSKKNQTNLFQSAIHDNNKENEPQSPKSKKLETDVKSYETLVTQLNKLSAEEQNIRKKMLTHKWEEILVPYENNAPMLRLEKEKHKEKTKAKNVVDKNTKATETNKHIIEKKIDGSNSSIFISSSAVSSSSSNNDQPVKIVKKNIHFKDKIDELIDKQSSSKSNHKNKLNIEKPIRNINNTLQRIKTKKQLLAKELSANTKSNLKKSKTVSSTTKTLPMSPPKRCAAGNDLLKVSPTTYAQLPDSFYNSQLEILKKQISKEKSKPKDPKCNASLNTDLIRYINELLKMKPLDVANLSTSSCSSVNLEESLLQHSKLNAQYYGDMLNCISKCLNTDISEISQDTRFNSPTNINLLNKLQELSNYYLEKTNEMKHICDESLVILNDKLNEQNTTETETEIAEENISKIKSSDSSTNEECVLSQLKSILQKKGLIRSDKDWPVFNNSDDDDDRSLTDQLLDICI